MKTIFKKLLAVYLVVLFISYFMIMIGANSLLQYYFMNQKKELLIEQANDFEIMYQSYNEGERRDSEKIANELLAFERYADANVWLINKNRGAIVNNKDEIQLIQVSDITNNELLEIFKGNSIIKNGYIKNITNDQVLIIGYPLKIENEVDMALFIMVSIPEINKTTSSMSIITIAALAISGAFAALSLSLITRSMNREIKDVVNAAKYIAKGNFDKKIKTYRNDELGELAVSFNYMADELCKTETEKRKFISNLSHDLRSPLTSITGYTRGIIDGTIPHEKQDRYLGIVLDESERLGKMVNNMLDLSKMESGNLALHKTDFDINEMLLHELDKFESRIIEKNLKLEIDIFKEQMLVHGDKENVRRVVYNLMDNALKFIDQEGTLKIKSEIKENKILVGIQNSSPVIPKEKLETIWTRFSKLDNSRGQDKKSTGLGLSIVREIVKAHDEKIEVYSNDDIGVLFIFSLSTQIFK